MIPILPTTGLVFYYYYWSATQVQPDYLPAVVSILYLEHPGGGGEVKAMAQWYSICLYAEGPRSKFWNLQLMKGVIKDGHLNSGELLPVRVDSTEFDTAMIWVGIRRFHVYL